MAATINSSLTVPNTYADHPAFVAIGTDVVALRATVASLVTQLTAARMDILALVTRTAEARVDILALRATVAALVAKLNLDVGVVDEDYAAPSATTIAAVAAATVAAPSAAPTLETTVT